MRDCPIPLRRRPERWEALVGRHGCCAATGGRSMVRARSFVLVAAWVLALLPGPAPAAPAYTISLGYAALHDLIPAVVGDCLEDEHHNPANGDALQRTTGGLLVWRKADIFTAFTDGHRTWVNGPLGLQQRLNSERFAWEAPPESDAAAALPDAV